MSDWSQGYVVDLPYTHGFYRELSPALLNFALTLRGFQAPSLDKTFAYCELGSGQGVSANLLAAANPAGAFWATDFNPSHAAGAAELAASGGLANIRCLDKSFQDFLKLETPAFDYIAFHGIYSWVSPDSRQAIVDIVAAKLRVGGVVYASYNTLPGWSAALPLRQLLTDFGEEDRAPPEQRLEKSLALADKLIAAKAGYFTDNPGVPQRLSRMKKMPRNYLVHEYLNRYWTPFYFTDVVRELGAAKLSFACSAHIGDQMDHVGLKPEAQALLNEIGDPVRRQQVRDYMVNQQFRRDVFVKGAVQLSPVQRQATLNATRFALLNVKSAVKMEVRLPVGVCKLKPEVYQPVLEQLAAGPRSLTELNHVLAVQKLDAPTILQAIMMLVSAGDVAPALPTAGEAERKKQTERFNTALMGRAVHSSEIAYLASPVTGAGVQVDRLECLLLLAERQKAEPIDFIWRVIGPQGVRLVADGKRLEGEAENRAELTKRATRFKTERRPVLQTLGIA